MIYRQPQYGARIDWGNPLTSGLVSVLCPSSGANDICKPGRGLTKSSSTTLTVTTDGTAFSNSTANAGIGFSSGGWGTIVPVASSISFYARAFVGSTGTRQVLLGDWTSAGSDSSIVVQANAANTWYLSVFNVNASGGTVTTGWHTIVADINIATQVATLYVDGVSVVSLSIPSGRSISGNSARWLGSGAYVGSIGWTGKASLLCIASGPSSAAKANAFAANPWQIFAPVARNIWPVGGAQAPTCTLTATETGADTAALSATADAAGTLESSEVGADTALLSISAQAQADLTASEVGTDTFAATISAVATPLSGVLAASETGADTFALSASAQAQATLTALETGADTFYASSGSVPASVILAIYETGADAAAFALVATATGTLTVTEIGADTASIVSVVVASVALTAAETSTDTFAATANGPTTVVATLGATEFGSDTASMSGEALVLGMFSASEFGADAAIVTAIVLARASMSVSEIGTDTALMSTVPYGPSVFRMHVAQWNNVMFVPAWNNTMFVPA